MTSVASTKGYDGHYGRQLHVVPQFVTISATLVSTLMTSSSFAL